MKLAGGINAYQYGPNPTGWVDPLGLSTCPGGNGCKPTHNADEPGKHAKVREGDAELPKGANSELSRNGAFKKAKAIGGVPQTQHPTRIRRVKITDQDQYTEGRVYIFELQERQIEILEHSLGHKKGNLGPHFNTTANIKGKPVPLKTQTDNHSYFKGKK